VDLHLKGRSALVVGASRGLGREIAHELAREGCAVAAVARSAELLETLRVELEAFGSGHAVFAADLTAAPDSSGMSAADRFAAQLLKQWRGPDIVVHNLGGSLGVTDPLAGSNDYRAVWQLNVGVPVELNKIFVPLMEQSGWGRVVHISSVSAENFSGYSAYVAAKGSLNAYVKTLSRNVAKKNVVVSAVCPGPLFAEGRYLAKLQQQGGPEWQAFCDHHLSVGRLAQPTEIAPFVALLCSPLASYAVGTIMNIDGGSR
jgi:3-oxoacyl-[acyl-carrier protein] reductase